MSPTPPRTQTETTPFVVMFIDRSGSSFLCSALSSHADLVCLGEEFCEVRVDKVPVVLNNPPRTLFNRKEFIRLAQRRGRKWIYAPTFEQVSDYFDEIIEMPGQACGFKFKYPIQHILFPEMEELFLAKRVKIVALFRQNLLKHAVSRMNVPRVLKATSDVYYNLTENQPLGPLDVKLRALMVQAENLRKLRGELEAIIKSYEQVGLDVLRVNYEDLVENQESELTRILGFLNVEDTKLVSKFKKATPNRLQDAMSNYASIASSLKGTFLEQYLEEAPNDSLMTPPPGNHES